MCTHIHARIKHAVPLLIEVPGDVLCQNMSIHLGHGRHEGQDGQSTGTGTTMYMIQEGSDTDMLLFLKHAVGNDGATCVGGFGFVACVFFIGNLHIYFQMRGGLSIVGHIF